MRIQSSPPQGTPSLTHYIRINYAQNNAFERFKGVFLASLEFSGLVSELKTNFEGVWAGSHLRTHELRVAQGPVFTWHGDFLLELLLHAEQAKVIL